MAHPDLERLFDSLFDFAQKLLSKQEGFHAWGATMSLSGDIQWVAIHNGEEFPEGRDLINALTDHFRGEAIDNKLIAAGICCDVRVVPTGKIEKVDAVRCSLEHVSGEALDVFVPYVKDEHSITYGEIFSWIRDPQFFLKHRVQ